MFFLTDLVFWGGFVCFGGFLLDFFETVFAIGQLYFLDSF